jgi:magnesium chelatase family protein
MGMTAKTFSSALAGVNARTITIEVNVGQGKGLHISGLVDMAVKESIHRVESAMKAFGYHVPRNKVVVNLAPADIRKEGSAYDLPIALSLVAASQQETFNTLANYVVMGELALDGNLRPVRGVLPIAIQSTHENFKGLILPNENAREAAIVDGLDIIGVNTLKDAIDFFKGTKIVQPIHIEVDKLFDDQSSHYPTDFEDVQGQENIKRAFEIAAAGGHNVIMIGPPGAGKTMLARSLPSILPPLTLGEALETTKIHSVAGKLGSNGSLMTARPYRSPHHTISDVVFL